MTSPASRAEAKRSSRCGERPPTRSVYKGVLFIVTIYTNKYSYQREWFALIVNYCTKLYVHTRCYDPETKTGLL
jgi:hypothetical protein